MKSTSFTALGIDVGGTKIALGVVRFPQGEVLQAKSIPTHAERDSQIVLEDMARVAESLVTETSREAHPISGVGIGICELVSPEGRILSRNCLSWESQQLRSRLSRLGPVAIEADVRAAARAEALFGVGRSFDVFLYLTIGSGISSCLVLKGEPYLGGRGATGTLASSPLGWSCEQCGDLNTQTLEDLASGPGIVRRLNQHRPGSASCGQEVSGAAAAGDPGAIHVIETAGRALGASVGLLVNVLDPQAIIVGGGLGLSEGAYWDSFASSVRRHIWSDVHRDVPILRAATGMNAGMIGAAAVSWRAQAKGRLDCESSRNGFTQ